MDPQQLVQAIVIAADASPSQDRALQVQAVEFLNKLNATDAWPACLSIFVDARPDGTRSHPPQARLFALKVMASFLGNGTDPLDEQSAETIKQALLNYIHSEFVVGPAEANATYLRNKVAQVLALFFLRVYPAQWPSFFGDILSLASSPAMSLLFFHTVIEISGEIFDQLLKSAREFTPERHARDGKIREAIRNGPDAAAMNDAVLALVVDARGKYDEVVDWGLRAFASYIPWIDVNFTVTPATIQLLFTLLSDPSLNIRLATSVALLRMVQKGLKEGADKLQLFKVLSLGEVLRTLDERTRAEKAERDVPNEDEELYREYLGRLLNGYGLELVKYVDELSLGVPMREEFNVLLQELLPTMLHFMGDDYDDTSSTIFPFLTTLLSSQKKSQNRLPSVSQDSLRQFWTSLLGVILKKMRWDADAEPQEDMDEDDLQAFETLRKDLRGYVDTILTLDQALVASAVQQLSLNTLKAYEAGTEVPWQDAELAVYLVFIFGELTKATSGGRRAFCDCPPVEKELRKVVDYSGFPLTMQGELMMALMRSGMARYPHPTVSLQFFETLARYGDFFRVRKGCVVPALEALIGPMGVHNPSEQVRQRAFYLFQRFAKDIRNEINPALVPTLIDGLRDVLAPQVALPDADSSGRSSPASPSDVLEDAVNTPSLFDSQLHLYESVGALVSLLFATPAEHTALLRSVVGPLLDELSSALNAAASSTGNLLPVLRVHHAIAALGSLSRGYPDYPKAPGPDYVRPPIEVFQNVAQAILVALDSLKVFKSIRGVARTSFGRLFAAAGENVVQYMPALMTSLVTHFDPTELADFVNFMSHLAHKLENKVFDVMNELIVPLNSHVSSVVSSPEVRHLHSETKKTYFAFLNTIMRAKLQDIFVSERNASQLQGVLEFAIQTARGLMEPGTARLATDFLQACVVAWAPPALANGAPVATPAPATIAGFESFVYERLVPLPFEVASSPDCNVADAQTVVLLNSLADLLKATHKVRGDEAINFLSSVYLPSQNCPPAMIVEFTRALRESEQKAFRKYYVDFVKALRRAGA
ncbi:ARM repeat-containing protein [Auricularia subglabra TFB-10046 SS5]|nr:ARM repeat-containing protein [Auricularia subglabra TFB-10046 SS5]